MGCGKSTVGDILETRGVSRLDADQIVRELLTDNQEVREALFKRWGSTVIDSTGEVNRANLAKIVFSDKVSLQYLEELLHPKVREHWSRALDANPERDWVVEIPLLFENNLETCFDYVIAVFVEETEQMRRLLRKGFSRETISERQKRQWPVSRKAELADFVLLNQGKRFFLEEQADYLLQFIRNHC